MKKVWLKFILTISLFLVISKDLSSQEIVDIRILDNDNGLKERIINHTIRDKEGFFYLFQENTIQRYDGSNFIDIGTSVLNEDQINLSDLSRVKLCPEGQIYLEFNRQKFLYQLNTKTRFIERFLSGSFEQVTLSDSIVFKNFKKDGLQCFMVSEYQEPNVENQAFTYPENLDNIFKIDEDFIVQKNQIVTKISKNKKQQLNQEGSLFKSSHGLYLFNNKGIYIWRDSKFEILHTLDLEEKSSCKLIRQDDQGNIIACFSDRPRYFHKVLVLDKNHELLDFSKVLTINDKFKDVFSNDVFDKWMTVGYNGVQIISWLKSGIKFFNKDYRVQKSEFGNLVTDVSVDKNNKMRFVREAIGIYHIDSLSDNVEEIEFKNFKHRANSKFVYHKQSDYYFLFGFRYDGRSNLHRINFKNNSSEFFELPIQLNDLHPISKNEVLCVGHSNKNGILGNFNIQTLEFETILKFDSKLRSISHFPELQQYWVGAYQGLYVYDENFKLIDQFDHKSEFPEKLLLKDHVVTAHRYQNKMILGLYGGGISIIDLETFEVEKNITDKNGLTDNNAIGILTDNLGNLWVSTFNGINVLDSSFRVIKKIYDYEGLPNREFNSRACAKDAEGNLFFGSLNGLAKIKPEEVLKWTSSEGLSIKDIKSYKNNLIPQDLDNYSDFYNTVDSIIIEYDTPDYYHYPFKNDVISYSIKEGNFKSKLSPSKLVLSDIQPGQINMTLTNGHISNTKEIVLTANKDYQFLIKFVSILFTCGLIFFIISKYIIDLNKNRESEKTKLNKRISELRLTALQSQMNPHFIFNALGSIQYFIQTKNIDKADSFLTKFASLMRLILESSKSKFVSVEEEMKLIELYLSLEQVRFENKFDYKISIDPEIPNDVLIPPMIIQPFIENSINHGLFNLKNRRGEITIVLTNMNEKQLKINIIDNGIGREKSKEFVLKKHKSRATQIINERIETFNANNNLNIEVQTIDLYFENEARGTEVILTINY